MEWSVLLHPEFDPEFAELPEAAQDELAALSQLLKHFGPQLSRPHADTLNGSKHANMKELRFDAADGAWRVAFAFDPKRAAILLVVGDKSGTNEKRFYRKLIEKADRRFDAHLADLKEVKNAQDDRRPNEKLAGKPARKGGRPRKGPRR